MYDPIDQGQIRLLKLHPGRPEEVVTTSLLTVDLMQAPPFEALSYVWGDYNERASLKVNGHAIDVHAELFNAIHTLRSPTSTRLIWADAICIDQTNIVEKGHQVSIMGQIYENAKNVAIYLGKTSERSEDGMRCMEFFTDPAHFSEAPPWLHYHLPQVEQDLADIIGRPWFQRIWTVQEATLARHTTLVCGEHQVSWQGDLQTMRSIVFRIKTAAISPYFSLDSAYSSTLDWSPLLNILETQMRQAARRAGVTLHRNHLDLAFDFRHRRCADPRDKYYAIFGIIENDQGGQLNLVPDYDVPIEELHDRFTAEIRRIGEREHARGHLGTQGGLERLDV